VMLSTVPKASAPAERAAIAALRQVLQGLTTRTARTSTPSSTARTYATEQAGEHIYASHIAENMWEKVRLTLLAYSSLTVLRVIPAWVVPTQPVIISLLPYSAASFTLPVSLVASLYGQLCGSMLMIKAIHWPLPAGTARPWLNSSTPLLSNLTSLEIGTVCNRTFRTVSLSYAGYRCLDG
jgi:hypothetical protein